MNSILLALVDAVPHGPEGVDLLVALGNAARGAPKPPPEYELSPPRPPCSDEEYEEARADGDLAAVWSLPLDDNPHHPDSDQWTAWSSAHTRRSKGREDLTLDDRCEIGRSRDRALLRLKRKPAYGPLERR